MRVFLSIVVIGVIVSLGILGFQRMDQKWEKLCEKESFRKAHSEECGHH